MDRDRKVISWRWLALGMLLLAVIFAIVLHGVKASNRAAREKAEALAVSRQLREMTLVVKAKGGGAGRLFGSVTNAEIADALAKDHKIELDKRKIVLKDAIKNVGTYTVTCKLGYEINADLTVEIKEL